MHIFFPPDKVCGELVLQIISQVKKIKWLTDRTLLLTILKQLL